MARLTAVLAYARLSSRRSVAINRSGSEKLLQVLAQVAVAWFFLRQLKLIVTRPFAERAMAAHLLVAALLAAWIITPFTFRPAIPARALAIYPISARQRLAYQVLSYLQNLQVLSILGASMLCLIAMFWLPHPVSEVPLAFALLTVAAAAGVGSAIWLTSMQASERRASPKLPVPASRRFPLLWKEFRYFARVLDFYLALLVSIALGATEHFGAWMTPAKATIPFLLLAVIQMPALLNPFGLGGRAELARYRLLPVAYWKLLLQKHLALALLFLASAAPLVVILLLRITMIDFSAAAAQLLLALMSSVLTGLLLMRSSSARRVRLAFASISGNGMSLLLALQAFFLLAVVPLGVALGMRAAPAALQIPLPFLLGSLLGLTYVWLLHRQQWPVDES